jgi:hypothetical protein
MQNDQLLSLVLVLKNSLAFYANAENYENGQIAGDKGHIARHAIEQAASVEKQMNTFEGIYEQLQGTELKGNGTTEEDVQEILKEIGEITKQNNGR